MITIKEIAELAGVTPTTVSNVIHGKLHKVSPQTVEKIQKLIKEVNYVPRFGLNALTNRGSGIIGVLINTPDFAEGSSYELPFYSNVIGTLENMFRAKDYYTMIFSSKNVEKITKMAMGWNTDGIIAVSMRESTLEHLEKATKKPVVCMDMDEIQENLIQKHYNVMSMDYKGGRIMTQYLLDNGIREIVYLANADRGADRRRYLGIRDLYREVNGLDARIQKVLLDFTYEGRQKQYKELQAKVGKNAALFFSSDLNAVELIKNFLEDGIRIPEDISVAGFDNNIYSKLCHPGLTTINCQGSEKAKAAGEMLLRLIDGEELPVKSVETDVYLVERDSVKRKRKGELW